MVEYLYGATPAPPLPSDALPGDVAGLSLGQPEWICVEAGSPGRWVELDSDEGRAFWLVQR